MVALIDGQPKLCNLKDLVEIFLEHRREVVTRRTVYELRKARERGHVEEDTRCPRKLLVFPRRDGLPHQLLGARIAGKGARSAAKDVAGELVEQDDESQAVQGRLFPMLQAAGQGFVHGGAEARANLGVELGAAAEPAFAEILRGPVLRDAVAQPELKDLAGGGGGSGGRR